MVKLRLKSVGGLDEEVDFPDGSSLSVLLEHSLEKVMGARLDNTRLCVRVGDEMRPLNESKTPYGEGLVDGDTIHISVRREDA